MENDSGIQIDLIGGLKRRAYMASVVAGAVTLLMYWIAMALPNEYTASSTLLVEPQSVSESLVEAGAAGVDLNERLNLMTAEILSRTRLSRIIEELGLYPEESEEMTRQEIVELMRTMVNVVPVMPELTRGMKTNVIPEINTFMVVFRSRSAKTAADVAQHLANDFIQEHIAARVNTTQTSLEFIAREETRLSERIKEIDADLAELKELNEYSLPENLELMQRRLDRDLTEMRALTRSLNVARSDVSFWQHQYVAAKSMVSDDDAREVYSAGIRLKQLELAHTELLSRGFTDRHPDVIVIRAELASTKAEMQRETREAQLNVEDDEPQKMSGMEQATAAEVQRAIANGQGLEAEMGRLSKNIEQTEASIAAVPRVAEQMGVLDREHFQLNTSLKSFSGLRLDASVQADLERRQLGERFRILEAAIAPLEITSPNRTLILALGVVLGIMLGVGMGVVLEATDGSYHREGDLQSSLGIPVLAVIPSIFFDDDLVKRKRMIRMRAFALTGVTGFILVSGFATYIAVNGAPGWLDAIMNAGEEGEEVQEAQFRSQPRGAA